MKSKNLRRVTEVAEYKDKLLNTEGAKIIYDNIKDLPIIDYHCHLSPKEIYEDKVFTNIGDLWLAGDHYKWRLMRSYGIDEYYITGESSMREKYNKFVEAVSTSFGNPIKDWVAGELEFFFNIDLPLIPKNADIIWEKANAYIVENKLSPRKLIKKANVVFIATTDDICDELEYHKLLANDFDVKIVPSFRTDNVFLVDNSTDYCAYIKKMSNIANVKIQNLEDLKKSLNIRILEFIKLGCKFSDVGIQGFPTRIAEDVEADNTFIKIINNDKISDDEKQGFIGNLYIYLGKLYSKYGMVMQLHMAVVRNSNSVMLNQCGKDSGFDTVGEIIEIKYIQNIINKLNNEKSLPTTILYTLNPNMYYTLTTLSDAFSKVHIGISWWFNDHIRGMLQTFRTVSELGHIESLVGMLTDSRSFLSYVRHDYYRQVLCKFLGEFYNGTNIEELTKVANSLCYNNANKIISEV
jgi:glucuronate isomerase